VRAQLYLDVFEVLIHALCDKAAESLF
jgi:hypothetical protein